MVAELTRRCYVEYGDDDRHLDYVAEWVEDGKTLLELAKDISKTIPKNDELGVIEVKSAWITRHLIEKYGRPEYDRRMEEARSLGSFAMVDDARDIADDDKVKDRDQIAKAKLRIEQRQWTAERFNKRLGTRTVDVNANVSMQTLHLDALRRRAITRATATMLPTSESGHSDGNATARVRTLEPGEPVDAEVINAESVITGVITPLVTES